MGWFAQSQTVTALLGHNSPSVHSHNVFLGWDGSIATPPWRLRCHFTMDHRIFMYCGFTLMIFEEATI